VGSYTIKMVEREKKNNVDREEDSFSPTLTSDFLMPNAWNLPLFIGDGRKTIYLF
jgi:hypothetical protein